ncbi:6-phosphogluconolactonase [Porphyromonas cangingivalis]|uniref:6-phosphogluconolactonase n=1 Tax=Porphyromonas cangingivalis TaxID=36874 RepID=UPI0009DFD630
MLGVGEDGHTSSLFPGQELYDIDKDFLRSVHPVNGIERVALSYEASAVHRSVSSTSQEHPRQTDSPKSSHSPWVRLRISRQDVCLRLMPCA